jgi:uncharacterized membrane protein YphA (DoxX/SURF4 family)
MALMARLLLALVFVAVGLAKFAACKGSRQVWVILAFLLHPQVYSGCCYL